MRNERNTNPDGRRYSREGRDSEYARNNNRRSYAHRNMNSNFDSRSRHPLDGLGRQHNYVRGNNRSERSFNGRPHRDYDERRKFTGRTQFSRNRVINEQIIERRQRFKRPLPAFTKEELDTQLKKYMSGERVEISYN
ncbi:hypothetical protein EDEG_00941 [Edhazardia aedis USNM 41457]|uniref:Uncharacterized protein n=1 Tax=Edhazardia aedis (strain USNM 41457) TaxID=1003232 RepID=J9DQR8_EDHAE|nr:hypothetical protein EDEG_00941 [Edhazardia aedis USNM 41457]|eukprot:EJW04910.1 hypothetical protein EDEG_00941 [Edhazardia aedis USNM 41457]